MRLSQLLGKRIINIYDGEIMGLVGDSDLVVNRRYRGHYFAVSSGQRQHGQPAAAGREQTYFEYTLGEGLQNWQRGYCGGY